MTSQESIFNLPSPLESKKWPLKFREDFENRNLELFVKRDDLIHSEVSGNKWRKLKFNIAQAQQIGKSGILTFGGAFSNHLLATAAACSAFGLKSIGLVRGEELNPESNRLLSRCRDLGMDLKFVERSEYSLRNDFDYLKNVKNEFSDCWVVPEGGSNFHGVLGCQEILNEINTSFDQMWVAQGTCTTSAGLLMSLPTSSTLNVVPVLKGFDVLETMKGMHHQMVDTTEWEEDLQSRMKIHDEYHFGGYAKSTEQLEGFVSSIESELALILDKVYNGKAFYAMCDYLSKNENIKDQKQIFLHTGGIFNA